MKRFTLVLCLLSNLAFGQKVVTTYYDWQKTKKKEVYETDANGTRHGNYKNFDEQGAVRNEGTFKFGKKDGLFIEYTKFPNYAGTMQVKSKETYVNDLKEGAAVYYNYDENLKVYEIQKGNYKQDAEEGDWIIITPFTRILSSQDYEYIKAIPAFKNSMAVKGIITYNQGEKVKIDPQETYYPSNKVYRRNAIDNSMQTGVDTYYYPDGGIWSKSTLENNKRISLESYYHNGKLKIREVMNPYSYEGYNLDGTPDNIMVRTLDAEKRNAEDKKQSLEGLVKSISDANQYVEQGNYEDAIDHLQSQVNRKSEILEGTEELKMAVEMLDGLKKQKADYKSLAEAVNDNHKKYLQTFQGDRFVNEHNMYDYPYPKGKNIYEKTNPIINSDLELVNTTRNITEKQKVLIRLNNNMERLQKISEAEWITLNKKLKKVDNLQEVKITLGLE